MLHYLPVTVDELVLPIPPSRPTVPADPALTPDGTAAEEWAEEQRDEAALESLLLARELGAPPTRLVVSADIPAGEAVSSWAQVDSIYADDTQGRRLAARVMEATSQEEADTLMDALFQESLMWHDVSEREALAAVLGESLDEV